MADLQHVGLSWVIRLQQCCSFMAPEKVLSFGAAQAAAKDRTIWRNIVVALCPTGDEEDK